MQIERRWNTRRPVTMNVALYYGGLGLVPCKTRDISIDGMYVKTGRIILPPASRVELVFTGYTGQHIKQHRLYGQVARVDHEGAGLTFENLEAGAYRFLQEIVGERTPIMQIAEC